MSTGDSGDLGTDVAVDVLELRSKGCSDADGGRGITIGESVFLVDSVGGTYHGGIKGCPENRGQACFPVRAATAAILAAIEEATAESRVVVIASVEGSLSAPLLTLPDSDVGR